MSRCLSVQDAASQRVHALIVLVVCVGLFASVAQATRPPSPAERAGMLAGLRAWDAGIRPGGYSRFRVSTIDARYAMVDDCAGAEELLTRRGSRWSAQDELPRAGESNGWFCNDPYRTAPARVMKELLAPKTCIPTSEAVQFVTPSNVVVCGYGNGSRFFCYVRSSRALGVMFLTGNTVVTIRQSADEPPSLRGLRGPVLGFGSIWRTYFGGGRCVSRPESLTCTRGGTGFVVSGAEVRRVG